MLVISVLEKRMHDTQQTRRNVRCGGDRDAELRVFRKVDDVDARRLALHDIDANKPGGSIKIRVKTYAHTLKRFEEELADRAAQRTELERRVDARRRELLRNLRHQLREHALTDRRARAELAELEDAFHHYLDEDTTPAGATGDDLAQPLRRADAAMYRAKRAGRDQAVVDGTH